MTGQICLTKELYGFFCVSAARVSVVLPGALPNDFESA
jgi:hypothetical protein